MCCLKYEQEAYEDLVKKAPKQESFVETPDGAGTVSSVNLLRQTVQVRLDSAPETPKCYHNCELCVIRSGKGRRPEDYVEPPLEELAKLRRQPEEKEAQMSEEEALTAALDAAFGRENPAAEAPAAPQEEGQRSPRSRRNRNRSRRPKGEGGEVQTAQAPQPEQRAREEGQQAPRPERRRPPKPPKAVQEGEGPAAAPKEGGEKKTNRRRRRRPRGGGEKPQSGGQD